MNSKNNMIICEVSIIILICQKLGLVGPVQQKLSCLCLKKNILQENEEHKREYWRTRCICLFFV